MASYTSAVAISPCDDGDWQLVTYLIWHVGRKGSGLKVTVPPGTTTDLATVPAWARFVFRTADARYAKASILHDWMLKEGWASTTAAAQFYEALRADAVPFGEAAIMGLAVLVKTARR